MKRINLAYWIVTGIMAAFMLLGALIDASQSADAIKLIQHLGYPRYFVPFIGVMKILGVIGVLQPWLKRIKEWAYAGLAFDVFGAAFSHIASGDGPSGWGGAILGLVLVLASYFLYIAREKAVRQPALS